MVVNADAGATQASETYSSDGFLQAPQKLYLPDGSALLLCLIGPPDLTRLFAQVQERPCAIYSLERN
jgi:hypothetical protein